MIKTKFKVINFLLNSTVYFFLVLFLVILLGNLLSPDRPLFHLLINPKKLCKTEICSFTNPWGWELKTYDDFNGFNKTDLAVISKYIWDSQKRNHYRFGQEPLILLKYQKKNDQPTVSTAQIGYFVRTQPETEYFEKNIDGKNVLFWRFSGNKCPASFVKDAQKSDVIFYNDKYESVTIVWNGDGFEGLFWGFPENENDFWKTIESIKWKDN